MKVEADNHLDLGSRGLNDLADKHPKLVELIVKAAEDRRQWNTEKKKKLNEAGP